MMIKFLDLDTPAHVAGKLADGGAPLRRGPVRRLKADWVLHLGRHGGHGAYTVTFPARGTR